MSFDAVAELIPSLRSCAGRMQAGELRIARRLASHLEDDYICWFDQPVGHRPRYADLVVLHAGRGLLLLEVKDWKLETIHRINDESTELLTSTGLKTVATPLAQARQCAYKLVSALEKDPQLVHASGKHQGRLIMPYGFGVGLTRITRKQFSDTDLGEVLPERQTICKDEMLESVEVEEFQNRLWDMFNYQFVNKLTQPQIDRVRWHMFPEIRMQPKQLELGQGGETGDSFELPELVKVMDLQQERIARGLGGGHRVIHGVARSGKTMILGYRCLHLAKLLHKAILVLCYNIALAARLRSLIREHQVEHKVSVYHFHEWCARLLRTYNFPVPRGADDDFDKSIELVVGKVRTGEIPSGQYGAILIDEGHDFKRHWLQLVIRMVDPDTKSLLLLYDDAQSIYENQTGLGFKLKEVGVEARGRTTILKLNYRNTEEIIQFAYGFARTYLETGTKHGEQVSEVTPDSAASDAKLLYVAMTRAMENLLLTSCKETPIIKRLAQSLELMSSSKSA